MEKHLDYNNVTIHYYIEGNGLPLIFVHGFGEDATVWDEQKEFLKQYCKIIIPDLPGSGKSIFKASAPEQKAGTIEFYAECIHAIANEENILQCIMLGHSMGGYITLAFAEQYANRLKGFGLVHSTAFADSDEKKKNRKKGIELIGEYGSAAFIKNTTPNLFAQKFKTEQPAKIEELIAKGKDFSAMALQQYYTAMMNRPDRTSVLQNSEVPVLFILGTEDVAAPLTDVLQQVKLPEIAYIHIFENAGHMGMWENATGTNKAIQSFIADVFDEH